MATAHDPESSGNGIPYPDELSPPITDDAALPPITSEDIAHTVERLKAGRESGEYTAMRESDLAVLWHVGQHGQDRLRAVLRDPSLLPRLLAPTVHA
ncbi:MAG TPA: hypothetical protein VFE42_07375 [Chloroflexota bacterium]|nr:hypothetical protein [Chloroflexota bacterium]